MDEDMRILNSIKKHLESSGHVDFVGIREDSASSSSNEFWYDDKKFKITLEFLKNNGPCKNTSVEERK